jgi:hypothetical protein
MQEQGEQEAPCLDCDMIKLQQGFGGSIGPIELPKLQWICINSDASGESLSGTD